MTLAYRQFLYALQNEVTLVGPLHDQPHLPTTPTIYVDGGVRFRTPLANGFATVSVGDGDSANGSLDEMLPREKDFSDLAYALRHLPASVVCVTLLGFLGGRRDHELANLGEVHAFLRGRAAYTRVDLGGTSEHVIAFGHGELTLDIRGTFSVFTLEPARVRIEGACLYPFDGELAPLASRGLSNGGTGVVRLSCQNPCFLLLEPA